jgi:hypothetical protein
MTAGHYVGALAAPEELYQGRGLPPSETIGQAFHILHRQGITFAECGVNWENDWRNLSRELGSMALFFPVRDRRAIYLERWQSVVFDWKPPSFYVLCDDEAERGTAIIRLHPKEPPRWVVRF